MGRNRKTFTDSFKKEVALEALKERNTVNEIAAKYGISASLVSSWKKEFLSGGFSKEVKQLKKELAEAQQRIEESYKELGKTRMENEILKKKRIYRNRPLCTGGPTAGKADGKGEIPHPVDLPAMPASGGLPLLLLLLERPP